MASTIEFVEYIADQLAAAGQISYRKMFGEYGMYFEGKFVAIICEDEFFLKVTDAGINLYPDLADNPHHEGAPASYHLVEDVDDREWLQALVRATWEELPFPKGKKRKGTSNGKTGL